MSKKIALLDAAQQRVRTGGYNNFSFRELAADVGIKSASVHYHFATKADLAAALARQYSENFFDALGSPQSPVRDSQNSINHYCQQFRRALVEDKKMCLCGLLGAQADVLPVAVRDEIKLFFQKNLTWLEEAYRCQSPIDATVSNRQQAVETMATLQGALMLSIATEDETLFELASQKLFR